MDTKIKVIDVKELISFIDKEKNEKENIDISCFCIHSQQVVNWICEKGHQFKEKIYVMYRRKNKCFICSGRQILPGYNDLQTLYPEIAKEFDTKRNKIMPNRISPRDKNKYWWTCKNGHPSFLQSVEHRVNRNTKCPYCSKRKFVVGKSDLETLYPEIAKEWDYEKNNGLLPSKVSPYTRDYYWWKCPKGHSYRKSVIDRTKFHKPIDCTKCIKAHSTSFPEQAIYYYSKKCFPDAINRYKEPFENGMELDIYIPKYRLGIEYDGSAYHNDEKQHNREHRKYLLCQNLGIKLIRIKEETKNVWNDTADETFFVKKRMKDEEMTTFLRFMFGNVFPLSIYSFDSTNNQDKHLIRFTGFPTDFDVSKDRQKILEYLIDIEKSFAKEHPELATMWDKDGNGKLTPFQFTSGSNYNATWKCPNCGKTWKSSISSIVFRKVSCCKECSMKNNGPKLTKIRTSKSGSLAIKSEMLLRQWDFEKNTNVSPYEIPLNYSLKVYWVCDVCGYKWVSSPNSRVRNNKISKCPHCSGRVAMSGIDDLETLYPKIAKDWDYDKNAGILPSHIRPYSNKKYYWICGICKNSYLAYPGNRIKGSGCPKCAHIETGKKNSKMVGQFDEIGTLINTYSSLTLAAKALGVNINAISIAVKNGRKSKGYYWRYI